MGRPYIDTGTKVCPTCNKSFKRKPSATRIWWEKQKYCSKKCRFASPEFKRQASDMAKQSSAGGPNFSKWIETHPNQFKKNHEKAINASVEWARNNPDAAAARGHKAQTLHPELFREIGRKNVKTGQIFTLSNPHVTRGKCGIVGHKHRSKLEIKVCKGLQRLYPKEKIQSCVVFNGLEIDFVIASDIGNVSGWEKVIEPHAIYWNKFTETDDYTVEREKQLRNLGITCPIEILIQG